MIRARHAHGDALQKTASHVRPTLCVSVYVTEGLSVSSTPIAKLFAFVRFSVAGRLTPRRRTVNYRLAKSLISPR
eukprot:7922462-Pyramimonas_sp.AAC.1